MDDVEPGMVSSYLALNFKVILTTLFSCVFQPSARSLEFTGDWLNIWNAAARCATSPLTCRAACYLMENILAFRLVAFSSITESVDSMITSTDLNAPSILADSVLSFWRILLYFRNTESPGASRMTSERVLHWFFSKWIPGIVYAMSVQEYVAN